MGFCDMNVSIKDHPELETLRNLLEGSTNLGFQTDEIKEWIEKTEPIKKTFLDSLNPYQRKLYNEFEDLLGEQYNILAGEGFIMGFKLASRLMLESLK